MISSQGTRISSQGEYPLSRQHGTMFLKTNRYKSADKHSHYLNIQYFYIANQKAKGHIDIKYCLTDKMIRDYMTKPLHGAKFNGFDQQIMHLPVAGQLMMAAVLH